MQLCRHILKGPQGIGGTNLVQRFSPTKADIVLIEQRLNTLGHEKEEVEQQVLPLQTDDLIETSHSVWASSVVMVCKNMVPGGFA